MGEDAGVCYIRRDGEETDNQKANNIAEHHSDRPLRPKRRCDWSNLGGSVLLVSHPRTPRFPPCAPSRRSLRLERSLSAHRSPQDMAINCKRFTYVTQRASTVLRPGRV